MKNFLAITATALLSAAAAPAIATGAGHTNMRMDHGAAMAQDGGMARAGMSEGTVKKINKSAGKITIAHGPLKTLGMPAMTMAYPVKDPAMLDRVKVGDKIRFSAESVNNALTVVALQSAQ